MPEDISIQYYNAEPLRTKGVSVSTSCYTSHQFPKHFHDHYTIQLVTEGVNQGFTEKHQYKVGPGRLLLINPGELHAGNSVDNKKLTFHTLRIEKEFIMNFLDQNEWHQSSEVYFNNAPVYDQPLFYLMSQLISEAAIGRQQNLESVLVELLAGLIQSQSTQILKVSSRKATLTLAYNYINDLYQKDLTLKEMAQACHLSPYHFSREFKKQFGLTPFQFLRNVRIERAKALLPKYSISRTAHQVGFYDHSHFLKYFKKIEGVTPSRLKAQ